MTNDCTVISNTIITNNMHLHVSTFKMSSSGSSFCLAKVTYRFSGLSKMKLLKYKMINFNKMLIVQRNKRYVILARHNELPKDGILNVETCRCMLFVIIVFDITVQSLVTL